MMHFYDHIIEYINKHFESIVAASSGAGLSLCYVWHFDPLAIVGKLGMTFLVGVIGGLGGYLAKAICNNVTNAIKKQKRKR